MQLVLGTIFCFGSIILPMLAWSILPQNLYFSVFNNSLGNNIDTILFSFYSDGSSYKTIISTKSTKRHFAFLHASVVQLNLSFTNAAKNRNFYISYFSDFA
jgi:hypothetical protein